MRMLFHNNRKAWMVCGVSVGLALLGYLLFPDRMPSDWFIFGMQDTRAEKAALFFFPALQACLLAIFQRKQTRRRCLRSGMMPKNIYQYHAMVLIIAIVFLLIQLYVMYAAFCY